MRTLCAFLKKEWMEQLRFGRLLFLGLLFLIIGIMNPGMAKLTPWIMEMAAETLEESGLTVTKVSVDAMTSWTQFFKNIPMGLIAFVLLECSIFTKEYQSGTLVLALTKGLERHKIVLAKTGVLTALWTMGYWMCFAVTYGYNAYFWDNGIVKNLLFSGVCWWVIGMFAIGLLVLFSVVLDTTNGVLLGTGAVFFGAYLLALLPKIKKFLPAKLMNPAELLIGAQAVSDYIKALVITAVICVCCVAVSIPLFDKKKM